MKKDDEKVECWICELKFRATVKRHLLIAVNGKLNDGYRCPRCGIVTVFENKYICTEE